MGTLTEEEKKHSAELGLYCEEGERILIAYVFSKTPEKSFELQKEFSLHLSTCEQVNCKKALEERVKDEVQTVDGKWLITLEEMQLRHKEENS